MRGFFRHPVVLVGTGVVIGYIFAAQVQRVPGVNKLPQV
jgi:hypothetical protein